MKKVIFAFYTYLKDSCSAQVTLVSKEKINIVLILCNDLEYYIECYLKLLCYCRKKELAMMTNILRLQKVINRSKSQIHAPHLYEQYKINLNLIFGGEKRRKRLEIELLDKLCLFFNITPSLKSKSNIRPIHASYYEA